MSYTKPSTTGYNGIHDMEWTGGTIEGMGKYNTVLNLFTLWHAKDCKIIGLTLKDCVAYHHMELNGCQEITVQDCTFAGHNTKDNYREMLQLDFSSESAIFLHPHGSKCYDNTTCRDIKILGCIFGPSSSRESFYTAIGNHCQPYNANHIGIEIEDCQFIGRPDTATAAIRLVAMDNVIIKNCYFERCGRAVLLNKYAYSYNKAGKKLSPKIMDGLCDTVTISNIQVNSPNSNCKAYKVYKNGSHTNVTLK